MKFNFIPFVLLLVVSLFTLDACSQEEAPSASDPAVPALAPTSYEFAGVIHNQVLEDLKSDRAFPGFITNKDLSSTSQKTALATDGYTRSIPGHSFTPGAQFASQVYNDIDPFDDFADLADHYYAAGQINAADRAAFYQLNNLVLNTPSTSFDQTLLNFEAGVQTDKKLSAAGRGALLSGSAVMRHSEDYWTGVRAAGNSNGWFNIEKARARGRGGLHWFIRDGMGAVGGFIVGFLTTGGNPVGAGVGAVVGGVAASALGR